MSAALKAAAQAAHTTVEEAAASPLLDQIISEMNTLAQRQSRISPIRLRSFEEIERFAERAKNSGMVPKDYIGKTDAIIIAIQMGSELGLPPMQSLQNIAVVNGRPSIWGDALPGLCRASGICKSIREWHEGEGDRQVFYCEAVRKDDPNPIVGKFSVDDAKRASLWKTEPRTKKHGRDGEYEVDSGPWYSYPQRMLQMRARGFALRDAFPDVLKGLITAEEAMDIPDEHAAQRAPERVAAPAPEPPAVKRTWADVIAELDMAFAAATTRDAVDAVLASEDCQKALDHARNGTKAKLDIIIKTALDRTATDPGPDANVEDFIARLPRLPAPQFAALEDNEAHKTWLRSLSEDDYKRVQKAIADRVGQTPGVP